MCLISHLYLETHVCSNFVAVLFHVFEKVHIHEQPFGTTYFTTFLFSGFIDQKQWKERE